MLKTASCGACRYDRWPVSLVIYRRTAQPKLWYHVAWWRENNNNHLLFQKEVEKLLHGWVSQVMMMCVPCIFILKHNNQSRCKGFNMQAEKLRHIVNRWCVYFLSVIFFYCAKFWQKNSSFTWITNRRSISFMKVIITPPSVLITAVRMMDHRPSPQHTLYMLWPGSIGSTR